MNSDYKVDKKAYFNRPYISLNEIIAYECHVKGMTADASCHVNSKGTFLGLIEKFKDLKEIGINQLILMPVYDFDEDLNNIYGIPSDMNLDENNIKNYWGFACGNYFSVKRKYAVENPESEFHQLVYNAHELGIEIIPMFYFEENMNNEEMLNVLIYWSENFGVDGFFLNVNPYCLKMISDCSKLSALKLYNYDIDEGLNYTNPDRIAIYDYEYRSLLRKMLLAYPNSINDYVSYMSTRKKVKRLCSVTSHDGFTLYDLYSYSKKHNEANGEFNHDGEEINYSDNCGIEGESEDVSVKKLRLKRIKNAFTMLLMADGIPMLLAGDELMNSQNGNNNAYCQDNEISWLKYDNKYASEIKKYLKSLIEVRNKFRNISFDRSRVNKMQIPVFDIITEDFLENKILYNTKCAGFVFSNDDSYLCLITNFDNYPHKLSIPHLPKAFKWSIIARTDAISDDNCLEFTNNEYILDSDTVYLFIAGGGK